MTREKFSSPSFAKSLKNGVLLCKLANAIRPGIVPKIQTASAPFVQMENINAFLQAEKILGIPTMDLFMTVDLFEEKNIGQVLRSLATLKRITGATTPAAGGSSSSGGGGGLGGSSGAKPPARRLSSGPAPTPAPAPVPQHTLSSASTGSGPKFCPQCGTKSTPGAKFCGECGGKLF